MPYMYILHVRLFWAVARKREEIEKLIENVNVLSAEY